MDATSLRFSRYNVWAEVGDHAAVFNGTTGALTTMSRADRDRVHRFVTEDGSGDGIDALLTDLVTHRVIVSDSTDELAELRRRYDDSRWRSGTLGYTVVTSLGCNFDCPYCFEDKHPSMLKPAVADALVDILSESLPSIGGMSVTWMGGEPLLGKTQLLDLSQRFIDVCDRNDKEYSASIITNGWYLDGATAAALAAARVKSAQVTIDGPPDVHDAKRPRVDGGPTFDRILANVAEAAQHLAVSVRVNVDTSNAHRVDELLAILADAGLAGRVGVGLGRITDAVSNESAPLASFATSCLSASQFASFELAFNSVAARYGFNPPSTPRPVSTPCTAVRAKEIVVGSDGDMWKCWDDIGDADQSIGTVFEYAITNDRLDQWLDYHPADDPQCSTCIAMPVCMGGCAHHEFHSDDREARCGSFRNNHVDKVTQVLRHHLELDPDGDVELPRFDQLQPAATRSVPVAIGATRRTSTPTPVA